MTTKKKVHIMDSVDILDRIDILLFQPVPGHFTVDFSCKEKHKQLTLDNNAKLEMERKVTELCKRKELTVNESAIEKTRGFILEYVGRFIQKCHKLDLAIIEDIPDAKDDHYAHLRRLKPTLN